jgi:hypothetical protein
MGLIQHFELQQGRVLDESLGPAGVFHSRKLHDDLAEPLLLDEGFGHPELVNPVPNGFEGLTDRGFFDSLNLFVPE